MNSTLQKQINDCIIRLEYIAAGVNPSDVYAGLCLNTGIDVVCDRLSEIYDQDWDEFRHKFYLDWPEYSGDVVAPVPSQDTAMSAFQYHITTPDKYEGEYGESRRRLAAYCAAKLRTYL